MKKTGLRGSLARENQHSAGALFRTALIGLTIENCQSPGCWIETLRLPGAAGGGNLKVHPNPGLTIPGPGPDLRHGYADLYVADQFHNQLTGVLLGSRLTVSTPLEGSPRALVISRDGRAIYASVGDSIVRSSAQITCSGLLTDHPRCTGISSTGATPVGREPVGIDIAESGRLYVANSGSDTLSVVDTASLGEITQITIGDEPYDVALGPQYSCPRTPQITRTAPPTPTATRTVTRTASRTPPPTNGNAHRYPYGQPNASAHNGNAHRYPHSQSNAYTNSQSDA